MQPRRLLAALATFIIFLRDWGEAHYWPVVLHIHPSWRLGWHSLSSSSQEPPLITRPLNDNWEYPYNDICHFLSILRCTLPNPTDSRMSLLAPNFTSLTSSPWFVCIRSSKEPASIHCSTPAIEAIPLYVCNPNDMITLELVQALNSCRIKPRIVLKSVTSSVFKIS